MSRVVPIQALHTAGDLTAAPSSPAHGSPTPTDVEAGADEKTKREADDAASLASAEIEQGLGVTKIEALCRFPPSRAR